MRWTIGKRIFAALTITSLLIVGANAVATRWSFQRGFVDYLTEQETERLSVVVDGLAEVYEREGSWHALKSDRRTWDELFREQDDRRRPRPRHAGEGGRHPPNRDQPPPMDPLDLRSRVTLVDASGDIVHGRDIRNERVRRMGIALDGEVIGALLVKPQVELTEKIDLNFASEQSRSTAYIGVAILVLAAVIAVFIARQLVRPIAALAATTKALAAGEFEKRITVARDDELGDLARDFNVLAETLQANQIARRQWVSDISHELRTPLAILSGELQAIEDGVRNFDIGTRHSLQAEVGRLEKLVTDLHELTLSDEGGLRYHYETVDIVSILSDTIDANQARVGDAKLSLQLDAVDEKPLIVGDTKRLDQLFTNLIENSLRYTDAPGAIEVRVTAEDQQVVIEFADSAPGVSADKHERLFDRLYRVDGSRNRATGGSGLGLSICEAIVKAHSGDIVAKASNLGGLCIHIRLPLLADSARQT